MAISLANAGKAAIPEAKDPKEEWRGHPGSEHVKHLGHADFQSFLDETKHVMVMFYAPWYADMSCLPVPFVNNPYVQVRPLHGNER